MVLVYLLSKQNSTKDRIETIQTDTFKVIEETKLYDDNVIPVACVLLDRFNKTYQEDAAS